MGKRSAAGILASPVFTGAVALLLVNDHVLKWRYPGVVTGKLSDVAGLVVVALLLRVVVNRDGWALGPAGMGFAWLKLVPGAPAVAAPLLGGHTVQDASDLLALLVLIPLAFWLRRSDASPAPIAPALSATSVITVMVALSAATATSCDVDESGVTRLAAADGIVWAGVDRYEWDAAAGEQYVTQWATSADDGRTWVAASAVPPQTARLGVAERCADDGSCWRVVPGQRVELVRGATVVEAFTFTDEQWKQMALSASSACSDAKTGSFGSLLVVDADRGGVVVAMGTQGVLRFDGETWERIAVLDFEPAPMRGPSWLVQLPLLVLAGLLVAAGGALVASYRRTQRHVRGRWQVTSLVAFIGSIGGLVGFGVAMFVASRLYVVWAASSIVLALVFFVASWGWIRRGTPTSSLPPPTEVSDPADRW